MLEAYVVDEKEKRATIAHCKPCAKGHTSLRDNARRDGSIVALPQLNDNESADKNTEQDKKCDDATIPPWIGASAPLESQQKADDGWQEDRSLEAC